jgi:hypothetical protein
MSDVSTSRSDPKTKRPNHRRPKKQQSNQQLLNVLNKIQQNTSFNTGISFVDSVQFPSGRTFDGQIYNFVDSTELLGFMTSSTVAVFSTLSLTLTNFGNVTNFAGVFDQYRFRMAEVTIYPGIDQSTSGTVGLLHTVIDYDDSNTPTITGLLDYQNVIVTRGDEVQKRTFVPHAAVAAYSGAFTSYSNVTSPWIDTSSPNVSHFGVKLGITPTTNVNSYSIVARCWIQFRAVR